MKVRYVHEKDLGDKTQVSANIMWDGHWPMRQGKFPADHPTRTSQQGFEAFRARGYRASPFPEGDGLTMEWHGREAAQVIQDIEECFGWEVTNK